MTSQGTVATQFKRALGTASDLNIRALAYEQERIDLQDALRVLLAYSDQPQRTWERALERWRGRYAAETRAGAAELALLHAALDTMRSGDAGPARAGAAALALLLEARGLDVAVAHLDTWADRRLPAR